MPGRCQMQSEPPGRLEVGCAGVGSVSAALFLERKKEIVAALSGIPTFTLANAKGEVYMRQDSKTGGTNIPWMIDGATALGHLNALLLLEL